MVVKTLFKVTNGSVSPSALRLSKRNPKNLCSILGHSRKTSATFVGATGPTKSLEPARSSSSSSFTRCGKSTRDEIFRRTTKIQDMKLISAPE